MKKFLATLLAVMMVLSLASVASAEGITLRMASSFGGTDPATANYQDLLAQWEEATGNTIDDASASSDEAWKASILNDFAAGNEPDLLFYFAAGADSKAILDKVVPIEEINEAYPDLNLAIGEGLREPDGNVYAIDVRPFWEGLFCNLDLFEEYGLELPTDVEKFETAVATFKENDIVPMGISLSDIPHYIVDFAILSSGSVEDYLAQPKTVDELPESWVEGMKLINHLYEIGAFPENVNSTTEELTTNMFLNKEAAMLLDGSWRINAISQENWDTTAVVPFPAYSEDADPTAILGGTSMGWYLTRKAWDDETKRDAAVELLAYLTGEEGKAALGFLYGGEIRDYAIAMTNDAMENGTLVTPIGDIIDTEVRNYWYNQIPGIADGTLDAAEVMTKVVEDGGFK